MKLHAIQTGSVRIKTVQVEGRRRGAMRRPARTAPDAIIAVNEEHHITLFNEGAERIFGYRRYEVLGKPLDLLLPERFRVANTTHIHKFGTEPDTARLMIERGGIFALRRDGQEFPPEAAICKITMGERRIYSVLLRDIKERKRQEAHARLLTRELEHRLHNILARIQMVVERSEDEGISPREFREALLDRIKSLIRAQGLLGRTNWHGVTIAGLIADQLKPFVSIHNYQVEGPEIVLNADATQALSMVIHELTTNAIKYGALSVTGGRVSVSWRREAAQKSGKELVLQWTEHGGPKVKLPQCEGYGTILIRELLTFEFDGTVDQRYAPEGLTCQISLLLDRVLEKTD
jgi:PAS domain S-box-containing protein